MEYIQGKPRSQIVLIESSLEEKIEQDNPVRIIDTFVNHLKLEELGFTHARHAPEGRPPYDPGDLLKLFIYGYLNRIRSSRLLERECKRNVELYWLLNELIPDHNTIANFRRDNPKAIKMVFRKMVTFCKILNLIGGKVIATDGTKLRAQNSKKNNFNQKKIDDHLKFIETRLHEYLDALDIADTAETLGLDPEIDKEKIREKIARLNERKHKHYLSIDFKTTNNNDTHALANMAVRAKAILGNTEFIELADKGYHTGEVGLIFIAYLFRRLMSILGLNGLKEAVQSLLSSLVKRISAIKLFKNTIRSFFSDFFLKIASYHFSLKICTFTPRSQNGEEVIRRTGVMCHSYKKTFYKTVYI